jgi:putative transposase
MRRSFKYRLMLNATQAATMAASLETHRRVYNAALAKRKDRYEVKKETLRLKHQYPTFAAERNRQIDDEKAGGDGPHWYAHISAVSMRDTIKRLDKAFDAFFRRVKTKQNPGYPRFKGRDRYDSIPFDNYNSGAVLLSPDGKPVFGKMEDGASLQGYRLKLFGVGAVRVKLHRPINGRIKTVTVKREADNWYVVFSCDLGDVMIEPSTLPAVGIDVGLKHFLTTSEGSHEPNPRYLKAELPELRRRQRSLCRKKKGGMNRRKAKRRVAKLHARIKNLRKEHHYQVACRLVLAYGLIAAESLNVQGMMRNSRLARAIGDAGWTGFLGILKGKAEKAGVSVVEVDAKYTSQDCSGCGQEVRKLLSEDHKCPHCGLKMNRDHNAALNILARGLGRTGPTGVNVDHQVKRRPRKASPLSRSTAARGGGNPKGKKVAKSEPLADGHLSGIGDST